MIEIKASGSSCARYFSPEAWKGVWLHEETGIYLLIPIFRQFPDMRTCLHLQCAHMRCASLFLLVGSLLKRSQIFASNPPWGLLSESHIYQLVVHEGDRPDRLDRNVGQKHGLTDKIWGIMEACWQSDPTSRPIFSEIVDMWQTQPTEDVSEMSRPISPSNSANGQIGKSSNATHADVFAYLKLPVLLK
jgi:hypothetical protein